MKLATRLALAAPAAAAALLVTSSPASAASADLFGTVCTCGDSTTYNNVRTVANTTNVVLGLNNKTATNLSISLINNRNGARFAGPVVFSATGTKTLATNVLATTEFKVRASMAARTGVGADNNWGGLLSY